MTDIYNMKNSVYIEEQEKDYNATATSKKPVVVVLIVSVVLILLLNLISTIIFY
jgi:flagellar basal body-associated protein FliL